VTPQRIFKYIAPPKLRLEADPHGAGRRMCVQGASRMGLAPE